MEVWWDPNRRNQHVKSASIKWNWNKILDLKGLIEILHGGQSFPKVGVKETGAYFFPQSEASVDLTSFSNYLVALASFNGGAEECESGKGMTLSKFYCVYLNIVGMMRTEYNQSRRELPIWDFIRTLMMTGVKTSIDVRGARFPPAMWTSGKTSMVDKKGNSWLYAQGSNIYIGTINN